MRTSRATTWTPVPSTFDVDRSTFDVLEDRVMQRHPRATAAAGIGYLILTSAGLVLAPMLDLGSSESAVRDYLRTLDTASFAAGGYLQLAAFIALLAFVVQLSVPGTATVARLAGAGATFALACVGVAMAVVGGVALDRTTIAPQTARVLMDTASLLTWISTIGLAVSLGAVGVVVLTSGELPRWMGWAALGTTVGFIVCLPLAESPVVHVPAALFDLWVLVAAVLLLVRSFRGHDRSVATHRVAPYAGEAVAPRA
jgi:hypothetical protein